MVWFVEHVLIPGVDGRVVKSDATLSCWSDYGSSASPSSTRVWLDTPPSSRSVLQSIAEHLQVIKCVLKRADVIMWPQSSAVQSVAIENVQPSMPIGEFDGCAVRFFQAYLAPAAI